MSAFNNPAVQAFIAQIGDQLVLAQVLIRRVGRTFELRHIEDRKRATTELRELSLDDLRKLAQFTASGAFRPLKSAPTLQTGWRFAAGDEIELESALNRLYPGAIADWSAAQSPVPPVTHYREFTHRQTGMYRTTTMLSDMQATRVTRACCHKSLCLKQRLWTVNGLAPDGVEEKSLIPCLDPCALLLEFARKAMRIEQEKKVKLEVSPNEAATLAAALQIALANPDPALLEADFNRPDNPRRLRLLLEKVQPLLARDKGSAEE